MLDAMKQWLLGVTACALLVSAAEQLCPEGSVRKIVRFTGGLLLLLAMLRLPASLPGAAPLPEAESYREAVARRELELGAQRENTMGRGIAAGLEAYIEDKAESLGADVRAEVTVGARGGVPVPEGATLRGGYNEELSAYIASELGIAKEKQTWIEGG